MLIPAALINFNRNSNTLVSLRNTNDCHVLLKLNKCFTPILQKSSPLRSVEKPEVFYRFQGV